MHHSACAFRVCHRYRWQTESACAFPNPSFAMVGNSLKSLITRKFDHYVHSRLHLNRIRLLICVYNEMSE